MKPLTILFVVSFVILAITAVVAFVKLHDQSALLVLHFDIYRGIDFLGSVKDVTGMIAVGFGITLVNLGLTTIVKSRQKIAGYLLGGTSVFLSILLFIAVLVIIANN